MDALSFNLLRRIVFYHGCRALGFPVRTAMCRAVRMQVTRAKPHELARYHAMILDAVDDCRDTETDTDAKEPR